MGGAVVVDPGRDRSGILSLFSVLIMAFLGQVLLGGARLLSELIFQSLVCRLLAAARPPRLGREVGFWGTIACYIVKKSSFHVIYGKKIFLSR